MNLVESAHLIPPVEATWRLTHKEVVDRLREAMEIVSSLPAGAILYHAGWDRVSLDPRSFQAIFGGRRCLEDGEGYRYVFIGRIKVQCFTTAAKRRPDPVFPREITLPSIEEADDSPAEHAFASSPG
ncbi:MAG: hypothetical protein KF777_15685 [Planctomycetaceae bacterium]|nr:hypothetical protein [Planctomycetaceae bacterium]